MAGRERPAATPPQRATTRVVNLRFRMRDPRDPSHVYIGPENTWYVLQGSKWRNPFRLVEGPDADADADPQERERVIAAHRRSLPKERPDLLADLPELRGATLYCFCAPKGGVTAADRPYVCHGQVLAELVDALPEGG